MDKHHFFEDCLQELVLLLLLIGGRRFQLKTERRNLSDLPHELYLIHQVSVEIATY